jgi:hypothetical protein
VKTLVAATVAALTLVAGLAPSANASSEPPLSLRGASGSSFTVTVKSSWRLDLQHMTVSGGRHYEGMALELLGRPANDGLSSIAMRLPDSEKGKPASEVTALGAVGVNMPAGRYLLVLVGDAPLRVSVPVLGSAKVGRPTPTSGHSAKYVDTAGTMALTPGGAGLYAGGLALRLPVGHDPLVLTHMAVGLAAGPQTFDTATCVHGDSGPCPDAQQATFGTGNTTSNGGALKQDAYYDGFDKVTSRQPWFDRADVRSTAQGSAIYAAAVVIDGGNR